MIESDGLLQLRRVDGKAGALPALEAGVPVVLNLIVRPSRELAGSEKKNE